MDGAFCTTNAESSEKDLRVAESENAKGYGFGFEKMIQNLNVYSGRRCFSISNRVEKCIKHVMETKG